MTASIDPSVLLASATLLLAYLDSKDRTKLLIRRGGFAILTAFIAIRYAEELKLLLYTPGEAGWQTILQGYGLLLGLVVYISLLPAMVIFWRHVDKHNHQ
ncbi:hypothetical protein [Pseudomonas cremoricolorata]|uniref:hypothetical protein n=1 Tax=Pseudomonas cremoricolorata TaxID=157783 RepID=UPI0004903856|nr:hypothetical protein [Pseudomonas cremoricolorata]